MDCTSWASASSSTSRGDAPCVDGSPAASVAASVGAPNPSNRQRSAVAEADFEAGSRVTEEVVDAVGSAIVEVGSAEVVGVGLVVVVVEAGLVIAVEEVGSVEAEAEGLGADATTSARRLAVEDSGAWIFLCPREWRCDPIMLTSCLLARVPRRPLLFSYFHLTIFICPCVCTITLDVRARTYAGAVAEVESASKAEGASTMGHPPTGMAGHLVPAGLGARADMALPVAAGVSGAEALDTGRRAGEEISGVGTEETSSAKAPGSTRGTPNGHGTRRCGENRTVRRGVDRSRYAAVYDAALRARRVCVYVCVGV